MSKEHVIFLDFLNDPPSDFPAHIREVLLRINCCNLGFCPNEGGEGPAQIFCQLFTNCICWVNLGMGREGETPAQIFWHIGVQKNGTNRERE